MPHKWLLLRFGENPAAYLMLVSPTCSRIRIAQAFIGCPELDRANAMLARESISEKITAGLIL
jgi:hypothetical protein